MSGNEISQHQAVLCDEVIAGLNVRPGGRYIDGTVGGGTHASAILSRAQPGGVLLGIDRDGDALERTRLRLMPYAESVILVRGNFADLRSLAQEQGWTEVDGILLDLGMSSDQLTSAHRGFSFQESGPLDMRMDDRQSLTAADLVNTLEEADLADIIWRLGEEPAARKIARLLVIERKKEPFWDTLQFADAVSRAVGGRKGPRHPATRTFQALRMAVNRELESLTQALDDGLPLLGPQGRMAVISFHSLEDRLVKHRFAEHVGRDVALYEGGSRWEGNHPRMRWVKKRPWIPTAEEINNNPRARSAKLRVVETYHE